MSIYELDIIYALPLLFAVAFAWQLLMHKIRFRMRQYYIENDYHFVVFNQFGGARLSSTNSDQLLSLGLTSIGYPIGSSFPKTLLCYFIEILYYIIIVSGPCYFAFIIHNCLGYEIETIQDVRSFLQTVYDEFLGPRYYFLILSLFILPHLWFIYFNVRRYKYFLAEKEVNAFWGKDVHAIIQTNKE